MSDKSRAAIAAREARKVKPAAAKPASKPEPEPEKADG